ncbi:MAG: transposase, partial [Christensenella sp.]
EQSLQNIKSERGVNLRINRSIQSEGTFGVLKEDYGFRRFMLRSGGKVRLEALLYCMAFNLNKLHNKTKNNRLGYLFYEKLIS